MTLMKIAFRKYWWKALGIVIFMYVLVGGMLTPLKPGIKEIGNNSGELGRSINISVVGYNSHYQTATDNRAYLKFDSTHLLRSISFTPESETKASIKFIIPTEFPEYKNIYELSLIINNEKDGTAVLPSSVFIKRNEGKIELTEYSEGWISKIEPPLYKVDKKHFPYRNILHETIRNTFFHVAIWMAMFALLIIGVFYSVKYLKTRDFDFDRKSQSIHLVAIVYGIIGLITGSIWAKYTWGTFWTTDIKLNMTAVTLLIYMAYFVLRSSLSDQDKRARLASGYAIFAFAAMIPLIFVIPRITDSLHPGNGGNPALGGEDLDNALRMYFYPSIIALILIGLWMAQLFYRYRKIEDTVNVTFSKFLS